MDETCGCGDANDAGAFMQEYLPAGRTNGQVVNYDQ